MAGALELDDLQGPHHPKLFYDLYDILLYYILSRCPYDWGSHEIELGFHLRLGEMNKDHNIGSYIIYKNSSPTI